MKILFYTNSFFPDPIGIAFYNKEWVEYLGSLGHEVEVLTALPYYPQWRVPPPYRGRWFVEERLQNVRVTRCWVYVPRKQNAFTRFLCELSFMLSSFSPLLCRRADLVIAVTPPFGVSLAAAVRRRLRNGRLWLHLQDLQVDAGQAVGFLSNSYLFFLLKHLERWVLHSADLLSSITQRMRERVSRKVSSEKEVALFPNWVDTETMRPQAKETAFRSAHGLQNKFVVLYAGSVGIHQGLDHLLEAAERLQNQPDVQFVVVGEGHYREALAAKIAQKAVKNLLLLPLQPKERLAEVLSSADVGIVLETRKMANLSMPSKIWNQMACGRPLVAVTSPETALAQTLTETSAGRVVSPGNADVLAMTILDLRSAPEKLQAMGEAARRHVCETASKEKILAGVPLFLSRAVAPRNPPYREYRLKRALDIALALAGFLVSSPLWLLIPILVRLEDRGPIFYLQERVGRDGKPFRACKFRSMHRMELPQFDRRQAKRGDPRITRAGLWLRRTAMDEVPQLWNILRGDMSFVGPRALMPSEVEVAQAYRGEVPLQQIQGYAKRILMRPGLTGIAQVFAARDVSRRNKFRYDLLYLKSQSLWLDISLILRSGWNSLTARWESVGTRRRPAFTKK
jgi:colanic acid biosynthesis glycosyl transferase WcaI